MKKQTLLFAALLFSALASAQFTFSVNPGATLNSAGFGYKVQKFVPYLGLQMFRMNGEIVDTGKENDVNTGNIVDYTDTYTAKLNIFLPTLGVKYFFIERNKIKAYGNLNFSKSFLSGEVNDSTDPFQDIDDDVQEILKETKFFNTQIGFGTEYFFDDNFSIGGEFGLNLMRFKSRDTYTGTVFDPNTGNSVDYLGETNFKANFNPTYAKFSLNFYFGK